LVVTLVWLHVAGHPGDDIVLLLLLLPRLFHVYGPLPAGLNLTLTTAAAAAAAAGAVSNV
jgi:hypothetical protein